MSLHAASMPLLALGTFVGMTVLDFLWARYFDDCNRGRRLHAAGYAMALTALSAGVVLLYVDQPLLVLTATLGAGLGTWLGVKPLNPKPPKEIFHL